MESRSCSETPWTVQSRPGWRKWSLLWTTSFSRGFGTKIELWLQGLNCHAQGITCQGRPGWCASCTCAEPSWDPRPTLTRRVSFDHPQNEPRLAWHASDKDWVHWTQGNMFSGWHYSNGLGSRSEADRTKPVRLRNVYVEAEYQSTQDLHIITCWILKWGSHCQSGRMVFFSRMVGTLQEHPTMSSCW